MQHKLSYLVAGAHNSDNRVEVISNTHLELAESILNMERDCGFLCYDVKIESGDFDNSTSKNQKQVIQQIARWCEILPDAIHIRDLK